MGARVLLRRSTSRKASKPDQALRNSWRIANDVTRCAKWFNHAMNHEKMALPACVTSLLPSRRSGRPVVQATRLDHPTSDGQAAKPDSSLLSSAVVQQRANRAPPQPPVGPCPARDGRDTACSVYWYSGMPSNCFTADPAPLSPAMAASSHFCNAPSSERKSKVDDGSPWCSARCCGDGSRWTS